MAGAFNRLAFEPTAFYVVSTTYFVVVGGAYLASGVEVKVLYGRVLKPVENPFVVTETPLELRAARRLSASSATYVTELADLNVDYGHTIRAEHATFNIVGEPTSTSFGRGFIHFGTDFILSGVPAGFIRSYYVSASGMAFSTSGNAATLRAGRQIYPQFGQYAYNGFGAGLPYAHFMRGESASLVYTGRTAGLAFGAYVGAVAGAYTYTGSPQNFKLVRIFRMQAAGAAYVTTGSPAGLYATRLLLPEHLAFVSAGRPTGFRRAAKITIASASYDLAGKALFLRRYFPPIIAGRATYVVTGTTARVFFSSFLFDESETLIVPYEARGLLVSAESKLLTILVEDYLLEISPENSLIPVPIEAKDIIVPYELREPTSADIWSVAA